MPRTRLPNGRIKRIHMNGQVIRRNKALARAGRRRFAPALTVQTSHGPVPARVVDVACPDCGAHVARVAQDFTTPLPSGAVAWIETTAPCTVRA
jgi:hypothetical protein